MSEFVAYLIDRQWCAHCLSLEDKHWVHALHNALAVEAANVVEVIERLELTSGFQPMTCRLRTGGYTEPSATQTTSDDLVQCPVNSGPTLGDISWEA
jgi:hypothetical protein